MRTRQKTYSDYGISDIEVKYIKEFCQKSNDEEKHIIRTALSELNPYIAPYIFYSLVDNLSYEDICKRIVNGFASAFKIIGEAFTNAGNSLEVK